MPQAVAGGQIVKGKHVREIGLARAGDGFTKEDGTHFEPRENLRFTLIKHGDFAS